MDRANGTRRIYRLNPAGVAAMREYMDRMWEAALVAFAEAFEDHQETKPTKGQDE